MGDESSLESLSTIPDDDTPIVPPATFQAKLDRYFEGNNEEREVSYSIVDPVVENELGQFWPLKDYDDTERGPIELPKELYPEGSKRNWAGNQVYNPVYEVSPVNKEQAKEALAMAFEQGHSVTIVGGAYGSSPLVSTRGVIINTQFLSSILDINLDITETHSKQTITVESGIPIMNVISALHKIDKILPTTPIFAKMAVGGGTAVGVHGTGKNFGTLCDYIEAMTILVISKSGHVEEKTYTKRDNPEEMRALSVNLGALGFVYSVTYEIVDMFNLKAVDQRVPWPEDPKELEKILHDIVLDNEYVELFWWPFTNFLWVKTWNRTDDPIRSNAAAKLETVNQYLQAYCANPFLGLLSYFPEWTPFISGMIEKTTIPVEPEVIVAKANVVYNYLIAVPPKHWDLNQCLNIPFVVSKNDYDFSVVAKSYIEVRKKVEESAKNGAFPLNTTLHTRFIGGSDGYLSPINGNSISAMMEVVSFNKTRDWLRFFKEVEDMWLSFGGRPHWGKLIYQFPQKKAWGGGTGMEKFMKVRERLDPHHVFRTDFHYDLFDRKLPKLISVKVVKAELRDTIWQRLTSFGTWISSFFYSHEYKVTIETAVDRREGNGDAYGNTVEYNTKMKNVNFTNFIQFQVICNNSVVGTAIWHLNLDNDLAAGHTSTKTLTLNPDWFTNYEVGTIEVELTPINVSYPACEESIAIIGYPSAKDLEIFARASCKAGLNVYVGVPDGTLESDVQPLLSIPDILVTTPRSAARSASLVIFVGEFENLREIVLMAGDLNHKILIDACERSGADDSAGIFAEEMSVARLEKDNDDEVIIECSEDAAVPTVNQWASLVGLTVSAVRVHESHSRNELVALPQYDKNPYERQARLTVDRSKYTYDHNYYTDCSIPGKFPILKDSLLDPFYLYNVVTRLVSQFVKYQVFEKFKHTSDAKTLSGYSPMSTFVEQYFPSTNEVWCPDWALGASRLGGPEPRGLRRLVNWHDLPKKETFPFTDDVLRRALGDKDVSVQREMDAGHLFVVNHKILTELDRVPAVPIAIFWWNEQKRELLPIVIQVFQEYHETENPLVTAKDGLLWETAKIYFQVATSMVHSSCSHEYDEHVIMGAFAMATPRQLSTTHPIYTLLLPHLHRTVSHAATRNCRMRCNVPTWFFDATHKSLRSLVTEASHCTTFYSLAFNQNIKDRKVEDFPPVGLYPYRDDGMLLWNAITEFVDDYVRLFYESDEDVQTDYEIQDWIKDLESEDGGRLHGVLADGDNTLTTIDELVRIVSTVIFMAGPHHAITHYVQTEYLTAPFHILPGLVRSGPLNNL